MHKRIDDIRAALLRSGSSSSDFDLNPDVVLPAGRKLRPAGVLAPIHQVDGRLELLLTKRSSALKHHPGQIAFPGGKQELTDNSLIETALRETHEEVGILPNEVEIIGNLPLYRTVSRYEVVPYIGFVADTTTLILDKNEVDSTFQVPLSFLLNKQNHLIHWVKRQNGQFPIYFIPWKRHNIWGATAAFVRNLSNHF